MKKFRIMTITLILLSLSALLFSAGINDTVVLHLKAYIPERTTFIEYGGEIFVDSNAYNFTYSMIEHGFDRTVMVVAN